MRDVIFTMDTNWCDNREGKKYLGGGILGMIEGRVKKCERESGRISDRILAKSNFLRKWRWLTSGLQIFHLALVLQQKSWLKYFSSQTWPELQLKSRLVHKLSAVPDFKNISQCWHTPRSTLMLMFHFLYEISVCKALKQLLSRFQSESKPLPSFERNSDRVEGGFSSRINSDARKGAFRWKTAKVRLGDGLLENLLHNSKKNCSELVSCSVDSGFK